MIRTQSKAAGLVAELATELNLLNTSIKHQNLSGIGDLVSDVEGTMASLSLFCGQSQTRLERVCELLKAKSDLGVPVDALIRELRRPGAHGVGLDSLPESPFTKLFAEQLPPGRRYKQGSD